MPERTSKQLAAGQVRSLRSIRKKLLALSEQWYDVDEFNMGALERLADQCEATAMDLAAPEEGES
ncbi:MAG: hypothetical protein HYX47_10450 [Burkholderiales bacterium]|nr:hypothetical protein [Burkholderiales bacterium]